MQLNVNALTLNTKLYGKYFHEMLNHGIYLAPAQFEATFFTTLYTKEDLDKTIKAHTESVAQPQLVISFCNLKYFIIKRNRRGFLF